MNEMKPITFHRVQSEQSSKRGEAFSEIRMSGAVKVRSLNSEIYRAAKGAAASAMAQSTSDKPAK